MWKRIFAEGFGTFAMVLMATGPSALSAFDPSSMTGRLVVALSTGFAIASVVYMVGQISGAHINPAVTIGYLAAGRFPATAVPKQFAAQFTGAILAAGLLALIAAGAPADHSTHHLGATGWRWSTGSANYAWWAAFLAEVAATFVFVLIFLTIRHEKNPNAADGLAIGLTAAGLLFSIGGVSGGSLNPARSLGPALFAGEAALGQLWLYFAAPTLGAILAGIFSNWMPLYDRPDRTSGQDAVDQQRNADR